MLIADDAARLREEQAAAGLEDALREAVRERPQAGLPQVRSARTKTNLDTAMYGEALAYATYMLFAAQAKQTGPPLTRLQPVGRHSRSGAARALGRRGG
ncbi:hypothetical protein [Streptomyces sp. NPDC127190]|uniref:hypothetical protein n=1 Tax=unclassified Streptomyces TaxID=2593676 RepID=UPI0036452BEF